MVQTGDEVPLDVKARILDLNIEDAELERRRANLAAPVVDGGFVRGYGKMYSQHITQAQDGCDFDFLLGMTPVEPHVELAIHIEGFHTG